MKPLKCPRCGGECASLLVNSLCDGVPVVNLVVDLHPSNPNPARCVRCWYAENDASRANPEALTLAPRGQARRGGAK